MGSLKGDLDVGGIKENYLVGFLRLRSLQVSLVAEVQEQISPKLIDRLSL